MDGDWLDDDPTAEIQVADSPGGSHELNSKLIEEIELSAPDRFGHSEDRASNFLMSVYRSYAHAKYGITS